MRSKEEEDRIKMCVDRMRATLDGVELGLRLGGPMTDASGAIAITAHELTAYMARREAYLLVESEQQGIVDKLGALKEKFSKKPFKIELAPKEYVCDRCKDTHRMRLSKEGHEDREVMCTYCPSPCQKCRKNGNGPYCTHTPCPCPCHNKKESA